MNEQDKALGAEAEPYPLLLKGGETLLLSPWTQAIQGAFVTWLKSRARQELYELRDSMTPQEFKEEKDDYSRRCLSGFYKFGGQTCGEVIGNLESGGVQYLFWLMLREYQPGITLAKATDYFFAEPATVQETMEEMNALGKLKPLVVTTPGAKTTPIVP